MKWKAWCGMSDGVNAEWRLRMEDLRKRRKGAGLTQAALATRCGCTQDYISKVECGVMTPGKAMLATIEAALAGKAARGGGSYIPPAIPFKDVAEEKALGRIWCERGYGGDG